jgi:hypothetical protein
MSSTGGGGAASVELPGADCVLHVRAKGDAYTLSVHAPGHSLGEVALHAGQWREAWLGNQARTLATVERIEGEPTLLVLGAWSEPALASRRFCHPFLGTGLTKLFRSGRLGRRIVDGGAGDAEQLLWSSLRALSWRYSEELLAAVDEPEVDLVLAYQPFFDLLLHELAGLLDPDCAHYRSQGLPVVERIVIEALALIERTIVATAERSAGRSVVLTSDHGMASVDTILYPNQALRDAGWLALNASGTIDAAESRCFFHPAETGQLCFNHARTGQSLDAARAAVLSVLDDAFAPFGGPVRAVETPPGTDADAAYSSTTYLVPGARRVLKSETGRSAGGRSAKTGDHALNDGDPRLDGVVIDVTGGVLAAGVAQVAAADVRALLARAPAARAPQPEPTTRRA